MTKQDSKKFYDLATEKILKKIDDLGLSKEDTIKAHGYAKIFRRAFLSGAVAKTMFDEKIDLKRKNYIYYSSGFCRVSSFAFAAAMGAADWELMCIKENEWDGKTEHHYLKHVPTGKFLDLTYDQFAVNGKYVPYELGHKANLIPTLQTDGLTFANAAGIDMIEILKENSRHGK